MSVFFVTGFPRSRTGWLANLLSVPPTSSCLHDVVAGCDGVEDLKRLVTRVARPSIGVSDPALALVWREVAAAWPGAQWVHIYRDVFEAARSYAAFLEAHGWGLPWDRVRAVMLRWERELAALEAAVGANLRRVDCARLDEAGDVRGVWDWLFAGTLAWPGGRFEVLRRLNVQTMPSKAPASKGWIQRAMAEKGKEPVWA